MGSEVPSEVDHPGRAFALQSGALDVAAWCEGRGACNRLCRHAASPSLWRCGLPGKHLPPDGALAPPWLRDVCQNAGFTGHPGECNIGGWILGNSSGSYSS